MQKKCLQASRLLLHPGNLSLPPPDCRVAMDLIQRCCFAGERSWWEQGFAAASCTFVRTLLGTLDSTFTCLCWLCLNHVPLLHSSIDNVDCFATFKRMPQTAVLGLELWVATNRMVGTGVLAEQRQKFATSSLLTTGLAMVLVTEVRESAGQRVDVSNCSGCNYIPRSVESDFSRLPILVRVCENALPVGLLRQTSIMLADCRWPVSCTRSKASQMGCVDGGTN